MHLCLLALFSATLALTIPVNKQVPSSIKDVYDKCTIIRNQEGNTIYSCPGCTMIVDKQGKLVLRTGDKCSRYQKPDDNQHNPFNTGKNDCQIIKLPNGDTLIQCPGCQKIIDKDGKTKLEQGKCKHVKDLHGILGEAHEEWLLSIQE